MDAEVLEKLIESKVEGVVEKLFARKAETSGEKAAENAATSRSEYEAKLMADRQAREAADKIAAETAQSNADRALEAQARRAELNAKIAQNEAAERAAKNAGTSSSGLLGKIKNHPITTTLGLGSAVTGIGAGVYEFEKHPATALMEGGYQAEITADLASDYAHGRQTSLKTIEDGAKLTVFRGVRNFLEEDFGISDAFAGSLAMAATGVVEWLEKVLNAFLPENLKNEFGLNDKPINAAERPKANEAAPVVDAMTGKDPILLGMERYMTVEGLTPRNHDGSFKPAKQIISETQQQLKQQGYLDVKFVDGTLNAKTIDALLAVAAKEGADSIGGPEVVAALQSKRTPISKDMVRPDVLSKDEHPTPGVATVTGPTASKEADVKKN